MIGGVQMTVEMTRSWWMLGKASSSQSPIASKRLFGSTLSVDCQSVFHLRTSFSRDLGNEMSFSQHAFYFIIKLWPDKFENFPKRGGGGGRGCNPTTHPQEPPRPRHRSKSTSFSDTGGSGRRKPEFSGLIRSGNHEFFKALAKEVHETTRNTSASPGYWKALPFPSLSNACHAGYWKAGNWQVLLSDINDISGRYQCVLGQ